jgi:hypothetical protein
LSLLACSAPELPRTEIVVVVDTDLALGEQVDTLRIEATGPDDSVQSASVELAAGTKLPHTLGLVREGGALGMIRVVAVGLLGDQEILRREAELSFIADKTLSLPMHLVTSCVARECGRAETCSEFGCVAVRVDATRLAEWHGIPPSLAEPDELPPPAEDAGDAPDGGAPELDAGVLDAASTEDAAEDLDSSVSDPAQEAGASDAAAGDSATIGAGRRRFGRRQHVPAQGRGVQRARRRLRWPCGHGYDLMSDTRHCGKCNTLCAQTHRGLLQGRCALATASEAPIPSMEARRPV